MGSRFENLCLLLDTVYEMKGTEAKIQINCCDFTICSEFVLNHPIQKDTKQLKSSYHIMHKP